MQYSCHLPSPIYDTTTCTKINTNPFPSNVSMYHFYPLRGVPALALVASYIVLKPVQSYIAYIRCIKIRTMVVLSSVSMYQCDPFRCVPSPSSIFHCIKISTIVHRLYTIRGVPSTGSILQHSFQ